MFCLDSIIDSREGRVKRGLIDYYTIHNPHVVLYYKFTMSA